MPVLRTFYRGLRLVLHLLVGLALALAVSLDRGRWLTAQRLGQWWSAVLLDIFNIQWQVRGAPAAGARLSVANHVSWLDIPLICACEPTRFVAKSEIARWPIAGSLADAMGTFYIRRGRGGARPLLDQLTPHLASGGNVAVFPEGTTTDGSSVREFHPRLFAAAVDAGCVVQPITIRYGRTDDGRNVAPFIGDDDLVSHVLRLLREPELTAQISYCAPISAAGAQRDALALMAQQAVQAELEAPALMADADLASWAAA